MPKTPKSNSKDVGTRGFGKDNVSLASEGQFLLARRKALQARKKRPTAVDEDEPRQLGRGLQTEDEEMLSDDILVTDAEEEGATGVTRMESEEGGSATSNQEDMDFSVKSNKRKATEDLSEEETARKNTRQTRSDKFTEYSALIVQKEKEKASIAMTLNKAMADLTRVLTGTNDSRAYYKWKERTNATELVKLRARYDTKERRVHYKQVEMDKMEQRRKFISNEIRSGKLEGEEISQRTKDLDDAESFIANMKGAIRSDEDEITKLLTEIQAYEEDTENMRKKIERIGKWVTKDELERNKVVDSKEMVVKNLEKKLEEKDSEIGAIREKMKELPLQDGDAEETLQLSALMTREESEKELEIMTTRAADIRDYKKNKWQLEKMRDAPGGESLRLANIIARRSLEEAEEQAAKGASSKLRDDNINRARRKREKGKITSDQLKAEEGKEGKEHSQRMENMRKVARARKNEREAELKELIPKIRSLEEELKGSGTTPTTAQDALPPAPTEEQPGTAQDALPPAPTEPAPERGGQETSEFLLAEREALIRQLTEAAKAYEEATAEARLELRRIEAQKVSFESETQRLEAELAKARAEATANATEIDDLSKQVADTKRQQLELQSKNAQLALENSRLAETTGNDMQIETISRDIAFTREEFGSTIQQAMDLLNQENNQVFFKYYDDLDASFREFADAVRKTLSSALNRITENLDENYQTIDSRVRAILEDVKSLNKATTNSVSTVLRRADSLEVSEAHSEEEWGSLKHTSELTKEALTDSLNSIFMETKTLRAEISETRLIPEETRKNLETRLQHNLHVLLASPHFIRILLALGVTIKMSDAPYDANMASRILQTPNDELDLTASFSSRREAGYSELKTEQRNALTASRWASLFLAGLRAKAELFHAAISQRARLFWEIERALERLATAVDDIGSDEKFKTVIGRQTRFLNGAEEHIALLTNTENLTRLLANVSSKSRAEKYKFAIRRIAPLLSTSMGSGEDLEGLNDNVLFVSRMVSAAETLTLLIQRVNEHIAREEKTRAETEIMQNTVSQTVGEMTSALLTRLSSDTSLMPIARYRDEGMEVDSTEWDSRMEIAVSSIRGVIENTTRDSSNELKNATMDLIRQLAESGDRNVKELNEAFGRAFTRIVAKIDDANNTETLASVIENTTRELGTELKETTARLKELEDSSNKNAKGLNDALARIEEKIGEENVPEKFTAVVESFHDANNTEKFTSAIDSFNRTLTRVEEKIDDANNTEKFTSAIDSFNRTLTRVEEKIGDEGVPGKLASAINDMLKSSMSESEKFIGELAEATSKHAKELYEASRQALVEADGKIDAVTRLFGDITQRGEETMQMLNLMKQSLVAERTALEEIATRIKTDTAAPMAQNTGTNRSPFEAAAEASDGTNEAAVNQARPIPGPSNVLSTGGNGAGELRTRETESMEVDPPSGPDIETGRFVAWAIDEAKLSYPDSRESFRAADRKVTVYMAPFKEGGRTLEASLKGDESNRSFDLTGLAEVPPPDAAAQSPNGTYGVKAGDVRVASGAPTLTIETFFDILPSKAFPFSLTTTSRSTVSHPEERRSSFTRVVGTDEVSQWFAVVEEDRKERLQRFVRTIEYSLFNDTMGRDNNEGSLLSKLICVLFENDMVVVRGMSDILVQFREMCLSPGRDLTAKGRGVILEATVASVFSVVLPLVSPVAVFVAEHLCPPTPDDIRLRACYALTTLAERFLECVIRRASRLKEVLDKSNLINNPSLVSGSATPSPKVSYTVQYDYSLLYIMADMVSYSAQSLIDHGLKPLRAVLLMFGNFYDAEDPTGGNVRRADTSRVPIKDTSLTKPAGPETKWDLQMLVTVYKYIETIVTVYESSGAPEGAKALKAAQTILGSLPVASDADFKNVTMDDLRNTTLPALLKKIRNITAETSGSDDTILVDAATAVGGLGVTASSVILSAAKSGSVLEWFEVLFRGGVDDEALLWSMSDIAVTISASLVDNCILSVPKTSITATPSTTLKERKRKVFINNTLLPVIPNKPRHFSRSYEVYISTPAPNVSFVMDRADKNRFENIITNTYVNDLVLTEEIEGVKMEVPRVYPSSSGRWITNHADNKIRKPLGLNKWRLPSASLVYDMLANSAAVSKEQRDVLEKHTAGKDGPSVTEFLGGSSGDVLMSMMDRPETTAKEQHYPSTHELVGPFSLENALNTMNTERKVRLPETSQGQIDNASTSLVPYIKAAAGVAVSSVTPPWWVRGIQPNMRSTAYGTSALQELLYHVQTPLF